MENINCPICGINNTEIIYRKGDLNKSLINVICKSCSLVYINPRPTLSEYNEFHKETFLREGHNLTEVSQFAKKQQSDLEMKIKVYDFIKSYIVPNNNILDIGCGFGTLLKIIKDKHGSAVVGLELSDLDVKAGKEYYNLDLLNENFDNFAFMPENENKFDVVITHHTFEHFPDPIEKLENIKRVLKPNGKLYIGVPNIMNIKKRPELFFQIGHPFSYSPHTLQKILKKVDFKVIKFNYNAAFPGAMEFIVAKEGQEIDLGQGENYQEVINYVRSVENKFSGLRRLRKVFLFWLPNNLRIKLTRFIYKWLKKR